MRTLGNFEIQPDAGAHVESVQPGDEQKRKLEPISEDILDRDTGKDASGAHLTEDPTKKRLPSLADREGDVSEGQSIHPDSEPRSAPDFSEALNDPNLFTSRKPKDYCYEDGKLGKSASGVLEIEEDPIRDPVAQREAGGDERRSTDDGGHLIGARFGGSPGMENLDAQDRNLNRGSYKRMENAWADSLNNGDRVYAHVDTYKNGSADRPDAYMGWTVTEHPDGKRDWDAFSFTNESTETQEQWEKELEGVATDDSPNPMNKVYEENNYINR